MRIIIFDAQTAHADVIERALVEGGHRASVFSLYRAFHLVLQRETFDLAIIADSGPEVSIVATLERVVTRRPTLPVVVLTHAGEPGERAVLMRAGATACLPHTPDATELCGQVDALLRQARGLQSAETVLRFGPFIFDLGNCSASIYGSRIALTRKEFDLAVLLFRNISRDLTRAYILEAVWGREPGVTTRTVDTHASRVRSKLGLSPVRGFILNSVYSCGYRLDRHASRDLALAAVA